jgi:hypothetical protein
MMLGLVIGRVGLYIRCQFDETEDLAKDRSDRPLFADDGGC